MKRGFPVVKRSPDKIPKAIKKVKKPEEEEEDIEDEEEDLPMVNISQT